MSATLSVERFNSLLAIRAAKRAAEALTDAAECIETGRLADADSLVAEASRDAEIAKAAIAKAQGRHSEGVTLKDCGAAARSLWVTDVANVPVPSGTETTGEQA